MKWNFKRKVHQMSYFLISFFILFPHSYDCLSQNLTFTVICQTFLTLRLSYDLSILRFHVYIFCRSILKTFQQVGIRLDQSASFEKKTDGSFERGLAVMKETSTGSAGKDEIKRGLIWMWQRDHWSSHLVVPFTTFFPRWTCETYIIDRWNIPSGMSVPK